MDLAKAKKWQSLATAIMWPQGRCVNTSLPKISYSLIFFFRWGKRFHQNFNWTISPQFLHQFILLAVPPVARTSSWISTLSPLRMASVCISVSLSVFQLIGSRNGIVRQLVGFSDRHETYVQFLSDQHPEEKPRLSTPWLCLFFFF
jgi:hypothetical protein